MGGGGVFVKELETALLEGEIDLAVHSAKDLPARLANDFILAAVPERAMVEDVFISRKWDNLEGLPPGATVATGSPRRRAMVKMIRPDLQIIDVRGNIDTRLRKLDDGDFDALILAGAGIMRLGLSEHITQVLPPNRFIPAPGQGALAVEILSERKNDVGEIAAGIDSSIGHACLLSERRFLETLGAGCSVPVGGWARMVEGKIRLDAVVFDLEGGHSLHAGVEVYSIEKARELGETAAMELLNKGAGELLSNVR